MNCNECKILIRELHEPDEILGNSEGKAHLQNCSSCQSVLQFEKKLRQSFELMAEEQPPMALTQKILNIPNEQLANKIQPAQAEPGLIAYMRQIFTAPMLKMALAASLTGFFAAIVLMRSTYVQPDAVSVTDKIAVFKTQEAPAVPEETKTSEAPTKMKELKLAGIGRDEIAQRASIADKDSLPDAAPSDDTIPGAVSFSLADEAEPMTRSELSAEAVAAESRPQLAMAKEAKRAMAPAMEKYESNESDLKKSSMSTTETAGFSDSFTAAPPVVEKLDPRALEIADLLTNHDIDLPEGFIKIEELAMRGFIDAAQLQKFAPPAGNGWFLQIIDGKKSIRLKKR